MKKLLVFLVASICVGTCFGLRCWECFNALTNEQCIKNGTLKYCVEENAICEDQVRFDQVGNISMIEKRCKQAHACENNVMQNEMPATPTQCSLGISTSICTCCCNTSGCNYDLVQCWKSMPPQGRNCPDFPRPFRNGNKQCKGNLEPGTTCKFNCHQNYYITGEKTLTCLNNGKWNYPVPKCREQTCLPKKFSVEHGIVVCTNSNHLRSRCRFKCYRDYALEGPEYIDCEMSNTRGRYGRWSSPAPPRCRPLKCPSQGPLLHGRFSCSNGYRFGSTCYWRCDENYEIFPKQLDHNTCLYNGSWDKPYPCCTLPCLPFAVVDLMVILDSSSSVGLDNWKKTKKFLSSFFDHFALRYDAAQFSVFRYNAEVITNSAIYFSNYTNNKTAFLEALQEIHYNGSGTNTGLALDYAANIALKIGDRPPAPNIVILITDGTSRDNVSEPGRNLRKSANVFVIPVGKTINLSQMDEIAGSPDNVIKAAIENGFEALDDTFAQNLAQNMCPDPCTNPFHPEPEERVTPKRLKKYIVKQKLD